MAGRKGKIYWNVVRAEFRKAMSKTKLQQITYPKALKVFLIKRRAYVKLFLNHGITKEIVRGPFARNWSGALQGVYGGNLYSFIGFAEGGDAVIQPVAQAISARTWMRKKPLSIDVVKAGKRFIYKVTYKMVYPSRDDLAKDSPMPPNTEPGSWLVRMETGFSGLMHYIYRKQGIKASVSGSAVMSTGRYQKRTSGFKRTSYISGITRLIFGKAR